MAEVAVVAWDMVVLDMCICKAPSVVGIINLGGCMQVGAGFSMSSS